MELINTRTVLTPVEWIQREPKNNKNTKPPLIGLDSPSISNYITQLQLFMNFLNGRGTKVQL